MNLTAREDIDAPKHAVYAAVTDFERFERRIVRRGFEFRRTGDLEPPEPGARWTSRFDWRGRPFDVEAELISVEPGEGYAIEAHSSGLICVGVVDLVALSDARTRLTVSLDIRATSLSARLLLQPLKLAGGSISRRFEERVAAFAEEVAGQIG